MDRPTKFEEHRWLGDRRSQVVYDVDNLDDVAIIEELLAADRVPGLSGIAAACFAPDTLAEARNRGYRPYKGNGSDKAGLDAEGNPDAGV